MYLRIRRHAYVEGTGFQLLLPGAGTDLPNYRRHGLLHSGQRSGSARKRLFELPRHLDRGEPVTERILAKTLRIHKHPQQQGFDMVEEGHVLPPLQDHRTRIHHSAAPDQGCTHPDRALLCQRKQPVLLLRLQALGPGTRHS